MRAGLRDAEFLIHDNQLVGVNLGWDFCAEHEWGIKRLVEVFEIPGVSKKHLGFDARKINNCPKDLVLRKWGKKTYLAYISMMFDDQEYETKEYEQRITAGNFKDRDLVCGWSERDFGIRTITPEGRKYLEELYEAFQRKDIVIFLGGRTNPFSNSGLKICIFSRLPDEAAKVAIGSDKDSLKLEKAAEKTGIEKKLRAIQAAERARGSWNPRCSWYALSPRWVREDEKKRTKYDVIFWLNPANQSQNNHGWFTVEELKQWPDGKGPIPKQMEK